MLCFIIRTRDVWSDSKSELRGHLGSFSDSGQMRTISADLVFIPRKLRNDVSKIVSRVTTIRNTVFKFRQNAHHVYLKLCLRIHVYRSSQFL
jgi:hypothetical protein